MSWSGEVAEGSGVGWVEICWAFRPTPRRGWPVVKKDFLPTHGADAVLSSMMGNRLVEDS